MAEVFGLFADFLEGSCGIFAQQEAEIHFGQAEIWADHDLSDRDEGTTEEVSGFPLEDFSEVFLDETGEFLLSCAVHEGVGGWLRRNGCLESRLADYKKTRSAAIEFPLPTPNMFGHKRRLAVHRHEKFLIGLGISHVFEQVLHGFLWVHV